MAKKQPAADVAPVPAKRKKVASAAEPSPAAASAEKPQKPVLKKRSPKPRQAKEAGVPAADAAPAIVKKPLFASDDAMAVEPDLKPKKKRKAAAAEAEAASAAPPKKKGKAEASSSASADALPASASKAALDAAQVARTTLNVPQLSKAVRALLTHVQRERAVANASLLDGSDADPPVHVLLATKQFPKKVGKAKECKPVPLNMPHPYQSLDSAEVCLITKDPQREYKDKLAELGVRAKVIGISKLKKKHKEYEAKRRLMGAYEVFLADARVLPMLPPLLGKGFFVKRKLPVGVDLTKKDLKGELEKAVSGSLYRHAAGTCNSFQIGTTVQSASQLVDNAVAIVEQAVKRIPGQWTNVMSLSLRTTNSVALPFYSSLPTE